MKQASEIKLPHDDFTVVPFEWTWVEFVLLGLGFLVLIVFLYFAVSLFRRWKNSQSKASHTPLELLRIEAMRLQVETSESEGSVIYAELSRILRRGMDVFYKTSLSAWNFEEISSQSELLSRYMGGDSNRVIGFLGRADRSIYSGTQVDEMLLKQDKKLVVDAIDNLCKKEQVILEGKK